MPSEYIVKKGDTLWDIAKKHHVSLQELIKANPQIKNPDLIYPGDKVIIPDKKLGKKETGGDCEDCPCKPIATIQIVSLEFLSDHALLKDYDVDWEDGGARYPKPEWTPSNQYPVSHTKDKPVKLKIKLKVDPPKACPETGTLRGEGPGGLLFEKKLTFKSGEIEETITSQGKLENKVQELNFSIQWKTIGTSVSISPSQTQNKMFVTIGDPTTEPRRPGITLKRMAHAVKEVSNVGSTDPHTIVEKIMSKWGNFNLDVRYQNAWKLAEDKINPTTGKPVGADCQTIVRYTQNVIKMVGCPGKSETIVVWAKPSAPTVAIENAWGGPDLNTPNIKHPINPWYAFLIDGNNNANAFEAALKFTHGGKTVYYAGGVGAKKTKEEVLNVFKSLSWCKVGSGGKLIPVQTIHNY